MVGLIVEPVFVLGHHMGIKVHPSPIGYAHEGMANAPPWTYASRAPRRKSAIMDKSDHKDRSLQRQGASCRGVGRFTEKEWSL